ncbi:MAG: hypothetical protein V2I33_04995 [Kangiellaceae bacterium]|jgi:PAS domain-containing protein|nr:hypothetical protein [Kangiellaceae bacterium]
MTDENMTEEEKLLEFLYLAPVGLIHFDAEGNVKMANPRVAQLFNRFAPGGYFANIFNFLDDFLPELKQEITNFEPMSGQVMENKRFSLQVPGSDGDEQLWLDVTIARQAEDRFFASLNNVTSQVEAENKKYITEQRLGRLFEVITKHVMFTLDKTGVIDSWNRTGDSYLLQQDFALGKVLSQILPITNDQTANYLATANEAGIVKDDFELNDKEGSKKSASLCISRINDKQDKVAGYSVVLAL